MQLYSTYIGLEVVTISLPSGEMLHVNTIRLRGPFGVVVGLVVLSMIGIILLLA